MIKRPNATLRAGRGNAPAGLSPVARSLLLPLAVLAVSGCGPEPPTAPTATASGGPSPGTGVSTTGRFMRLHYRTEGGVTLTVAGDMATLRFDPDFRVDPTPGPYVYLGTEPDANRGTRLRIGPLTSNTGAQSYSFTIPAGVAYQWALIWCEPFNVGIGAASLAP